MSNERLGLPSASSISRIAACPGSHRLSQGIEAFRTQEMIDWAETGDMIHEVLAGLRYKSTLSPEDQEQVDRHVKVDQWIFDKVGLDANSMFTHREQRLWLEDRGDKVLSGKADLIAHNGTIGLVTDYKTNRGQQDPADENFQILTNIVLAAQELPAVDTWYGAINQPLETSEPVIVSYNREQLAKAREKLLSVVHEAGAENAVTNSGTHCKYCPAILQCSSAKSLLQSFGLMDTTDPDAERIGEYLKLCEAAEPIIKRIKAQAKDMLKKGTLIPGWKLGKPQTNRIIEDPFAAFKLLEEAQLLDRDTFLADCLSTSVGDIEKAVQKFKKLGPTAAKDTVNSVLVPVIKFKPKEAPLEGV